MSAGRSTEKRPWGVGEAQYRVPKIPVAVTMVLEGGIHVAGDVHLLPEAGRHDGRERVLDLFRSVDPFVPLTSPEGSILLKKKRIVVVRTGDMYDAGWEASDLDGIPEAEAVLDLAGLPEGENRLIGTLRLLMPQGEQRLLDYLNASQQFVPIMLEDGPALVSTHYIRSVSSVS